MIGGEWGGAVEEHDHTWILTFICLLDIYWILTFFVKINREDNKVHAEKFPRISFLVRTMTTESTSFHFPLCFPTTVTVHSHQGTKWLLMRYNNGRLVFRKRGHVMGTRAR